MPLHTKFLRIGRCRVAALNYVVQCGKATVEALKSLPSFPKSFSSATCILLLYVHVHRQSECILVGRHWFCVGWRNRVVVVQVEPRCADPFRDSQLLL
jgi:hypothetical protein